VRTSEYAASMGGSQIFLEVGEEMSVALMAKNALLDIKSQLEGFVGQRIKLKANGGRRKTIEREGVLEETYPSVFIVKLDEQQHAFKRVSYSYADILTETVELTIMNEDEQVRITYAPH